MSAGVGYTYLKEEENGFGNKDEKKRFFAYA